MADDKKVMDVAKPTEAKVDIGSKPMIVGHKPMAQDPMFAQTPTEPATDSKQENTGILESAKKKTIVPLSSGVQESTSVGEPGETQDVGNNQASGQETPTKIVDVPLAKPPDEPQETTVKKTSQKTGDKDTGNAKEKSGELNPEALAMEREDEVQKLVANKKYFVNVHQTHGSSKTPHIFLLVLLVVGLLGGLFYLVDTKKLDLGFELPFSVFKRDKQELEAPVNQPLTQTETVSETADDVGANVNETSDAAPDMIRFVSNALGLTINYPNTMGVSSDELSVGGVVPEDSPYVVLDSLDKETACCRVVMEDVMAAGTAAEGLKNLFSTGGLQAVAAESHRVNVEDMNVNLPNKMVSELEQNKRGEFNTVEFTVTEGFSTGFFNDTVSGLLVEDVTRIIFFESNNTVVRLYTLDNEESIKIVNTLVKNNQ